MQTPWTHLAKDTADAIYLMLEDMATLNGFSDTSQNTGPVAREILVTSSTVLS